MDDPGFTILHDDVAFLVVNKPSGLLTQAPPGIDSLEVRIKRLVGCRDGRDPSEVYLGVPHRLDRPASGAMVFCTRRRAAMKLSKQFEAREVNKVYWALVEGDVTPAEGTWADSVYKVPGMPRAEIVAADHAGGRPAVLHYCVRGRAEWGSWLEVRLETGRTHQVRVQAAARGHPVVGDAHYGSARPFGPPSEDERQRAIALHARLLEFRHPKTRDRVSVAAPVAECWQNYVN